MSTNSSYAGRVEFSAISYLRKLNDQRIMAQQCSASHIELRAIADGTAYYARHKQFGKKTNGVLTKSITPIAQTLNGMLFMRRRGA